MTAQNFISSAEWQYCNVALPPAAHLLGLPYSPSGWPVSGAARQGEWCHVKGGDRPPEVSASPMQGGASLTLEAERLLNRTWLLGSTAMACEKNSMASSWFPALKAALPLACGCGVAAYGTDL